MSETNKLLKNVDPCQQYTMSGSHHKNSCLRSKEHNLYDNPPLYNPNTLPTWPTRKEKGQKKQKEKETSPANLLLSVRLSL